MQRYTTVLMLRLCRDPFLRAVFWNVVRRRFAVLDQSSDPEAVKCDLLKHLPAEYAPLLSTYQLTNWPLAIAQAERLLAEQDQR